MDKKNKKGLSVEELKVLQAKISTGEKLTPDEEDQLLEAELAQEESDRASKDDEQMERLANLIAKRIQSGATADGGKPFVPASPEEVAKRKKLTQAEKAEEYYNSVDLPNFPWPGIHVTSDLLIFMGHIQGENARDNHVRENKGMTFESFPKPQ